jgi:hypothetical protein
MFCCESRAYADKQRSDDKRYAAPDYDKQKYIPSRQPRIARIIRDHSYQFVAKTM